jgi:hypothetical protein
MILGSGFLVSGSEFFVEVMNRGIEELSVKCSRFRVPTLGRQAWYFVLESTGKKNLSK